MLSENAARNARCVHGAFTHKTEQYEGIFVREANESIYVTVRKSEENDAELAHLVNSWSLTRGMPLAQFAASRGFNIMMPATEGFVAHPSED